MKALLCPLIFYFVLLPDTEAIAGGRNVTIEEVPWLVMLKSGTQVWSGVLIDHNLVVSIARFCKRPGIEAYVGSSRHAMLIGKGISIDKKNIFVHPEFNTTKDPSFANCCIMKLDKSVRLHKNTQKAALPDMNEPMPEGIRYHVAGWGPATLLKYQTLSVYPTVADYDVMTMNSPTSKDVLWLNYKDGIKQRVLNNGDEGGPLFHPKYGRVFGLVNNIEDPGKTSHFAAFKLPRMRDWIEERRGFFNKN